MKLTFLAGFIHSYTLIRVIGRGSYCIDDSFSIFHAVAMLPQRVITAHLIIKTIHHNLIEI